MIEMKVMKNRKEWLGKRSKYIGGSDCACILGLNPYKSNVDLYLEKIGEKQPQDISYKPQVKFGIAAEPIIRELFQINYPQMQMNYVENNNFINDKYPFARASLDGWLSEIAKRKAEAEQKALELKKQREEQEKVIKEQKKAAEEQTEEVKEEAKEEAKQWVSFKCLLTVSQARALGRFFKENNITFRED